MIDKEQIIKEAKEIHGNKYDYSKIENIKNVNSLLTIICPIHGEFKQTYWNHIHFKKGCKLCGHERNIESRRLKLKDFIERSKKTHNDIDNYDFTNVDLSKQDSKKRIKIYCKKHGEFMIRPSHFMNGIGCQKCCGHQKTDEEVKEELTKIHPNLDFSITKFSEHDKNYRILVICPKHGIRNLNYYNLRNGKGCDLCKGEKAGLKNRMKYKDFIKKAEEVHGIGTYFYEENIMENRTEEGKIKIICPIHGEFYTTIYNFLGKGSGCPKCKMSHLEKEISVILKTHNIIFEQEKTFDWLKYKNNLFLDFYLPDYNIAIECQGRQHFEADNYFGGEETFKNIVIRDFIKKDLCQKHNINLLYFSHENIKFPYKVYTNSNMLLEEIVRN